MRSLTSAKLPISSPPSRFHVMECDDCDQFPTLGAEKKACVLRSGGYGSNFHSTLETACHCQPEGKEEGASGGKSPPPLLTEVLFKLLMRHLFTRRVRSARLSYYHMIWSPSWCQVCPSFRRHSELLKLPLFLGCCAIHSLPVQSNAAQNSSRRGGDLTGGFNLIFNLSLPPMLGGF